MNSRTSFLMPDRGIVAATAGRSIPMAPRALIVRVALVGIRPWTQNGHIRNDTRDVSRRILNASFEPICRKNYVADDRACTRVTLSNFHGKEGVSGSSPEEGSAKVPQSGASSSRRTCSRLIAALMLSASDRTPNEGSGAFRPPRRRRRPGERARIPGAGAESHRNLDVSIDIDEA
jgi:hypothetical protein